MDGLTERIEPGLREPRPDPDDIERIAHVGSWTMDPATGEATWSAEMYRIFGLDVDGPAIALADIPRLFTQASVDRVTAAVEHAVRTAEPWTLELEIVRADGTRGWVASNGLADLADDGTVVRIHGTMHDITEHRMLEDSLRQSQRLEAVGQLAGGVAHDFNNILTAIRGYTELVLLDLGPNHPSAADLAEVTRAADRAADLVKKLLAFSRRAVLQPEVLDPSRVIDEIMPLLERLIGEDVAITMRTEERLGRIEVDPGQLGQVIINLVVNARDAMPRGGRLTIELQNVLLDAAQAATHLDSTPGQHVLIAVSDTGHGMDRETQARAFEPFFTTKGPESGTGMGLATVFGIVKQSGGSIYLYSEPGRGTTFKLYFPRTDAAETLAADAPDDDGPLLIGHETVLLVEDDPAVRRFARRVLEEAGFTVFEAGDGVAALEIAARNPGLDLLLTDAVLPGIGGGEIAERLHADRPGLPVLYVSGFTEDSVVQHGVVAPGISFLAKPYRGVDLLRRVRAVLDGRD